MMITYLLCIYGCSVDPKSTAAIVANDPILYLLPLCRYGENRSGDIRLGLVATGDL
jgi:hypothetical protein